MRAREKVSYSLMVSVHFSNVYIIIYLYMNIQFHQSNISAIAHRTQKKIYALPPFIRGT